MTKEIEIQVYPHGTKVYLCIASGVVEAEIVKREINEFDFVNYGVLIPERKTPVWIKEDEVFTDFEEFIINLRGKFTKK